MSWQTFFMVCYLSKQFPSYQVCKHLGRIGEITGNHTNKWMCLYCFLSTGSIKSVTEFSVSVRTVSCISCTPWSSLGICLSKLHKQHTDLINLIKHTLCLVDNRTKTNQDGLVTKGMIQKCHSSCQFLQVEREMKRHCHTEKRKQHYLAFHNCLRNPFIRHIILVPSYQALV